jgi:hypothetical protein
MMLPLFTLVFMMLSLWGVVGKVTYVGLDSTKQQMALEAAPAKNYLVKDIQQSDQLPAPEPESLELRIKPRKSIQQTKVDPLWGTI